MLLSKSVPNMDCVARYYSLPANRKHQEMAAMELAYEIDWVGLERDYREMGYSKNQIEDEKREFFQKCAQMMMKHFGYFPLFGV